MKNRQNSLDSFSVRTCLLTAIFYFLSGYSISGDLNQDGGEEGQIKLAYRIFIDDLPTWGSRRVHPDLVRKWLADAPAWILDEVMSRSVQPGPVLIAAQEALRKKNKKRAHVTELLLKARLRFSSGEIQRDFDLLLIKSGHAETLKIVQGELDSMRPDVRVKAAEILAVSGKRKGFYYLKKCMRSVSDESDHAARALGRLASPEAFRLLEKCCTNDRKMKRTQCRAGLGEAALRKKQRVLYDGIRLLDPAGLGRNLPDGLYTTWFEQAGVHYFRYSNLEIGSFDRSLVEEIRKYSKSERPVDEKHVRRLKELREVIHNPPWTLSVEKISSREEAAEILRMEIDSKEDSAERISRIQAAVHILKELAQKPI